MVNLMLCFILIFKKRIICNAVVVMRAMSQRNRPESSRGVTGFGDQGTGQRALEGQEMVVGVGCLRLISGCGAAAAGMTRPKK